jgi:hypothetical protein
VTQLRERLLSTTASLRSAPKAPNNGILPIESGNFLRCGLRVPSLWNCQPEHQKDSRKLVPAKIETANLCPAFTVGNTGTLTYLPLRTTRKRIQLGDRTEKISFFVAFRFWVFTQPGSKANIANPQCRVCSASQSGRLDITYPSLAADALVGFSDLIPTFCV